MEITGGDYELYPDYLDLLGRCIADGLSHRAKYVWLERQYRGEIELMESLPEDHPFRVNEQDIRDAVACLPSLADKAATVRVEAVAEKLGVANLY